MRKLNYIDLFAGAGGLSEGFKRVGFEPIAHVEMVEAACFTMRTRAAYYFLKEGGFSSKYDSYLKGLIDRQQLYSGIPDEILNSVINAPIGKDTNEMIFKKIDQNLNGKKEVDLIIGGPPCQAYSIAGRSRSSNNMEGDPRNFLYIQYAEYLSRYKPKMFVFENVLGIKSAGGGFYLKEMEKLFNNKGYSIHPFQVNARQFGVLQNRKRYIIIGWRKDFIPNLLDFEKLEFGLGSKVQDVLSDLEHVYAGERKERYHRNPSKINDYLINSKIGKPEGIITQHIARPHTDQDKKIYEIAVSKWDNEEKRIKYNDLPEYLKTHKNRESFQDRFKVVAGNLEFSQTVVAHIAKDGHYYIHPDKKQNRSLTVREAARIQSFPDDFYFEGTTNRGERTAAFTQIGNVVPPLMAEKIANSLIEIL